MKEFIKSFGKFDWFLIGAFLSGLIDDLIERLVQ